MVISFLFSGTMQTKLGLCLSAIFNISLVAAISKFNGIFNFDFISFKSISLMCLLSSLKCIVTEWAPHFSAIIAARNGLGYISPLAFLTVAT